MNKKFFSALLFGSLVMGGTFVSCSDYDDDIENLQGQIDKLAGKAELDSQVSSLSSQISAAQGAADAAKTAAAAAQAAADAAKGVADSKLDEAAVKAIAEAAAEGAAAAAQEGKDAAAVAQAAADAAQAAADAAQATADKGVSAAEAAQAAADAAAAAAQKTADKLAEYATKAELKAAQEVAAAAAEAAKKAGLDAAKVAADAAAAAQKTADEAVAAAKKAAEDAAAAKKAGVEAAAEAAKKAEAAQKTADEAVAAAEAAKKAADAAKKAADAAQATADAAKSAAEKVAADLTALDARVKALETSLAALLDKDGLNELLKNVEQLKQDADKIFPVVANYITSVDLYTSSSLVGGAANPLPSLNFTKAIEKKTSFGPNDEIKFEDGKVKTYDQKVTIRVSPVTADLTKDMISLINSQGASLGEFVRVKEIKRNTRLLTTTRAAESGLWDVTFELIEENYTDAKFMSATRIDSNRDGKLTDADEKICFAIAINNTGIEDRLVVSAYDVVASYNNAAIFSDLQFTVNNVQANKIHNRYTVCEDGTSTTTVSELAYNTNALTGFAVPAVKEQFVSKANTQGYDNKYNVINLKNNSYTSNGGYANRDDRQGENFLVAKVGEDITITVNNTWTGSTWSTNGKDIRALYVTFDEKNGIESAPSEINAWNSYKANIENLGKVVEGNTVTLKINDKSADGDVIGFRVYAVNLDGTVIDPDGRSFYVAVGNYSEASSVVETIINAFKKLTVSSNAVEVPAGFFPAHTANITLTAGQLPTGNEFERIVVANNNPKYGATPTASPEVTYTFYKQLPAVAANYATKVSEAKYAVATFADASKYIDGETYSQTIKVRKSINPGSSSTPQWVDVKTIKFTTKKSMPTTFPADFAFRPMQEITAGSGKFRSYMVPGTDPTQNDYATAVTVGSKDLNNIFYGLDDNYKFSIAKSVWDAATWSYSENKYVTYNGTAPAINYIFDVDAALIDGQTEHAITASYMYRNVSTKKNNDGTWSVGVDYPVNYGQNLAIIYDCWFNASTFAWWTGERGTTTAGVTTYTSFNKQPVLQWSADPTTNTTCSLSDIVSTNTYNNSFFGTVYGDPHKSTISSGNLDDLVNTKGWLTIDGTSNIHLMYGNQVDPYFTVSYSAGTITFNQEDTQVDANPTADHKETLVIPVKDAYGHKTTIQLEVLVKKAI